jgi:hypothetical protein
MSLNPSYKPKESEQRIPEELTESLSPRMRKELDALSRIELIRPAGCTGDTPEEIAIALVLELSKEAPGVRFTVIQKDDNELPEVRIEELPEMLSPRMRKESDALSRIELIGPAGCTGDTPEEIAIAPALELSKEAPGVRFTVIQKVAQYFTSVPPSSIVDARAALLEAADRFEAFLSGQGSGSQLARLFDDLDVAGLRSTASWVPVGTKVIGADLYELFGIATSGNRCPAPGQSESKVYEAFQGEVEAFIREHEVRT